MRRYILVDEGFSTIPAEAYRGTIYADTSAEALLRFRAKGTSLAGSMLLQVAVEGCGSMQQELFFGVMSPVGIVPNGR